jgi:hypothetical protein
MKKIILLLFLFSGFVVNAGNILNFDSCLVMQPNGREGIDAEIFSCSQLGYDTTNYGDIEDFCATDWTKNGYDSKVRSLIFFDLSGLPANKLIKSAKLSLYFNPSSPEGQHSSLTGSNNTVIRRIISPWNEHTVTWNNRPQTTATHQVFIPQTTSSTQNFIDIDITQLVIDSRNNPASSFGFMFKLVNETHYRKIVMASSDHSVDSLRPKLVICFQNGTGYDIINTSTGFNIYPNPAETTFHCLIDGTINDDFIIELIDLSGKKLTTITPVNNQAEIDVSTFSPGFYFVVLSNKDAVLSRKKLIIH